MASATSGDVANAASGEGAPSLDLADDSPDAAPAASQGGCTLTAASPASPLGLLSTLGLALAYGARRRRSNGR